MCVGIITAWRCSRCTTYSASMEQRWQKDTKQVFAWRTRSAMKVRSTLELRFLQFHDVNFFFDFSEMWQKHIAHNRLLKLRQSIFFILTMDTTERMNQMITSQHHSVVLLPSSGQKIYNAAFKCDLSYAKDIIIIHFFIL